MGIVVVIILIIVGFNSNKKTNETGAIEIGVITPLTGDLSSLGQGVKAAAELAVSEINNAGGINGRQVSLVVEDGKCDGKEAVTAVTKLVNIDKVTAIIGGSCSSETIAAAPIAEKAKVVMISPSSSNPALTNAGDYIFRDYPSDAFQGVKAAEFAVNTLKAKKIAVLSCIDDYCQGIGQVFSNEVASLGATILTTEKYDKSSVDLKTQLAKIKDLNPDLLYFIGYTDGTIAGLKQAKDLGLKTKILGADSWNDPTIALKAGAAAEGTMYLIPAASKNDVFDNAIEKITGGKEVMIGTRESYDAMNILAQVMKKVGTDGAKIKDALYQVQDYQGISGKISFDKNGDLVGAQYAIKVVKGGIDVNY